jgi:hypothetical protein
MVPRACGMKRKGSLLVSELNGSEFALANLRGLLDYPVFFVFLIDVL